MFSYSFRYETKNNIDIYNIQDYELSSFRFVLYVEVRTSSKKLKLKIVNVWSREKISLKFSISVKLISSNIPVKITDLHNVILDCHTIYEGYTIFDFNDYYYQKRHKNNKTFKVDITHTMNKE